MQETIRPPGRPRDPDVIARDEIIYQLIANGISARRHLAARTGLDRSAVRLSCERLRGQGRIRKCPDEKSGSWMWVVADGTPCP